MSEETTKTVEGMTKSREKQILSKRLTRGTEVGKGTRVDHILILYAQMGCDSFTTSRFREALYGKI